MKVYVHERVWRCKGTRGWAQIMESSKLLMMTERCSLKDLSCEGEWRPSVVCKSGVGCWSTWSWEGRKCLSVLRRWWPVPAEGVGGNFVSRVVGKSVGKRSVCMNLPCWKENTLLRGNLKLLSHYCSETTPWRFELSAACLPYGNGIDNITFVCSVGR